MLSVMNFLIFHTQQAEWIGPIVSWIGWLCLAIVFVILMGKFWEPIRNITAGKWILCGILLIFTPLTSYFISYRSPIFFADWIVKPLTEQYNPRIFPLAALPWALAAGMIGPFPAVLLALFSGILLAAGDTYSIFTPILMGYAALAFSKTIRQPFRTRIFHLLRHPIGAAIALFLFYFFANILFGLLEYRASLAIRLNYAITQTWNPAITRWLELCIASFIAEIIYLLKLKYWNQPGILVESPVETSLHTRFIYGTVPFILLLLLSILFGSWLIAGNLARRMVQDRLSGLAKVASNSIPFFIETGQSLILYIVDDSLVAAPPDSVRDELARRVRSAPYFSQFVLLDREGIITTAYPEKASEQIVLTKEEIVAVRMALKGVMTQTYFTLPSNNERAVQISMIVGIKKGDGKVGGVLIGRADLVTNPFTKPIIRSLESEKANELEGVILDKDHRVLYHTNPNLLATEYIGRIPEKEEFFEEINSLGEHRLVYYQPVNTPDWAVILSEPAELVYQNAYQIVVPILAALAVVAVVLFIMLQISMRWVTSSLKNLAREASLISQGQLDHPLQVNGVDELGKVGKAFEQMRLSLKARLEELNRLLYVSQSVASNLEVSDVVRPILEAALGENAISARIVLKQEVAAEGRKKIPVVAYGMGNDTQSYAYLDDQIFELMRQQDILPIANTARFRHIAFPSNQKQPVSLIALTLKQESQYHGTLWIAYDRVHSFTDEEIRFLTMLSSQAALAASNARLYASAEIGRQRLEAVLSSTPDPVMVFDKEMRLLLLNPATLQVPGLINSSAPGYPVSEVIANNDLVSLLMKPIEGRLVSREIFLDGGVYFASICPIFAEDKPFGKICILRDITHYKKLDTLKSDFVETVSHDLRSPLTLIRGYSTMLQMVGSLNEQQMDYMQKIVEGVEEMTRLVSNLLDLGRLDAGIGLQIEKVVVNRVVEEVVNSLQPQAKQRNIQLEMRRIVTHLSLIVEADSALLSQAIINVIENAIKYSSMDGVVTVVLRELPENISIEVHDNGSGIAPIDLPHVFDKFFRSGRRSLQPQRGTGLGLAIVKSIVEHHHGNVRVESQLGKGSVFYIDLPYQQQ